MLLVLELVDLVRDPDDFVVVGLDLDLELLPLGGFYLLFGFLELLDLEVELLLGLFYLVLQVVHGERILEK